jgi:hypothetical protein
MGCNCKKNIRQAPQVISSTPEPIKVPQTPEEPRQARPSNIPGSSATSNNRLKEKARNLLQQR